MSAAPPGFHLLTDLALILCVAAATTVIFQRIRQPVIPGYLLAGGPLVAIVQPFYPSVPGAAVLLGLLAFSAYPLWRSAANLHGHARAGAQVILEAVVAQGQAAGARKESDGQAAPPSLAIVPGLGSPALVKIETTSPALGRSLRQLGLRGRSGATVIAISRGEGQVVYPDADDELRAGDVLVLTGTAESVEQAKSILTQAQDSPSSLAR